MATKMNWWKTKRLRCFVIGKLPRNIIVLVLLVISIGLIYRTLLPEKTTYSAPINEEFSQSDTIDKETILRHLYHLQNTMKVACNDNENIQLQMEQIIALLGGTIAHVSTGSSATWASTVSATNRLEVCPEVWLGTRGDYPFYYQGWRQENCSNVLPFENVITILLYHREENNETCPQTIQKVLSGLRKLYPKLQVIIGGVSKSCLSKNESLNVTMAPYKVNQSNPGVIWNQLIKLVTTPYVLVGRDLDGFIWTTNLERQVRMLSYNTSLSVAGGAVRNLTGHWRVGCFQTTMRNYILKYLEGYYASRNECMFCDHLSGPFVTRTKLLQSIQFDEFLPADVLFEDWFWRLQQQSHVVVNCPDVMYLASDSVAVSKFENRTLWISFVQKWKLNRIVMPSGRVFSFSCSEASISCMNITLHTNSFLIPICCLEQYAYGFKVFHDFCVENNIRYELDTGSVLGALKVNGMMPWDLNSDTVVYTSNYSFFKAAVPYFQHQDLILHRFLEKKNQETYFSLNTPYIRIEMWGVPQLSHDNATFGEPFRLIPTQALHHGYWVYAPHSPGTYSRNRYGPEVLQHAHNWRHAGIGSAFQSYLAGTFNRCERPGHHACLDLFSADGNIQFKIPN